MARAVFELRVLNDAELTRAFSRLSERVQKRAMRKAMKRFAAAVESRAKELAPKMTGALAEGIKTASYSSKSKGQFGVLVRMPTRKELAALYPTRMQEIVGGHYYYPAIVEYKHKPFLRPAFDEKEGRAIAEITADLRKAARLD